MPAKKRRGPGNRRRNAADDAAEAARQKRRDEVWRLRTVEGLSHQRIAQRVGVSVGTVENDIQRAREEHRPPDADELAAYVRAELQRAVKGLRRAVDKGSASAVQAHVKALDAFAKLHGLYAPTKSELSGPGGGPVDIRAAQDELLGRLSRIAAGSGSSAGDPKPDGGGSPKA